VPTTCVNASEHVDSPVEQPTSTHCLLKMSHLIMSFASCTENPYVMNTALEQGLQHLESLHMSSPPRISLRHVFLH
jgi:hypothetical protein